MIIKVTETEAEGVGPLMRGTGLNEVSVAKKGIFPHEKILGEIGTTIGVLESIPRKENKIYYYRELTRMVPLK